MIQIINSLGQTLQLFPDTSISIERNNPLFNDDDKLFEDISYSFKVPASANNKVFFQSGHLVEANNSVYKIPVQCIVAGLPFYAGSIKYSFIAGDFEALLLLNFGALAEKLKTVTLTDIYTDEIFENPITAYFMKTVCENPQNYPFSFFPVKNTNWDGVGAYHYNTVNSWDHQNQYFSHFYTNDITGTPPPFTGQSAYFKLKYILQKVFDYLGLPPEGSFMDDEETDKIYLYNRIYVTNFMRESSYYFPKGYTISEFLKLLKNDPRFKLSISFDMMKGIVKVESYKSQIKSAAIADLRAYASGVEEISLPETNGYLISLKPDNEDDLFKDVKDPTKHVATNKLLIAGGEKVIEVETSTLKEVYIFAQGTTPEVKQTFYQTDLPDNPPIRFIKYNGMIALANSKVYPEAKAMELTVKDAEWYRFLNDSKALVLTANLPLNILLNLESGQKIGFLSKEGFYTTAILEKTSFSLKNEYAELIPVKLACRTMFYNEETSVSIIPVETPIVGLNYPFKAFFDPEKGINVVKVEMFYPAGTEIENYPNPDTTLTVPVIYSGIINKSTDRLRGGGSIVYLEKLVLSSSFYLREVEVRVFNEPKYLIFAGVKIYFTFISGTWVAKPFTTETLDRYNFQPIWIVF